MKRIKVIIATFVLLAYFVSLIGWVWPQLGDTNLLWGWCPQGLLIFYVHTLVGLILAYLVNHDMMVDGEPRQR